jgi:secreted trypsin-like serine protease
VSTCRGDSGGPLQCPTDSGIWVHEGIDSYGKTTCGSGVPTVFTKTEKFLDWINKIRKDN